MKIDKKIIKSMQKVVDYLYYDEHKDWQQNGSLVKDNHIFHSVKALNDWLNNQTK